MQTMGQGINLDCCFEVVFLIHACAFPLTYLYLKRAAVYSLTVAHSNSTMKCKTVIVVIRISSFCSQNLSNGKKHKSNRVRT